MCHHRRRFHEVLLFSPRSDEPEPKRTLKVRSLVAARAVAKVWLRPHVRTTTRALYHWDARYLWSVTIVKPTAAELPRDRYEIHEAERVIVPSVGEVGVW